MNTNFDQIISLISIAPDFLLAVVLPIGFVSSIILLIVYTNFRQKKVLSEGLTTSVRIIKTNIIAGKGADLLTARVVSNHQGYETKHRLSFSVASLYKKNIRLPREGDTIKMYYNQFKPKQVAFSIDDLWPTQ